MRATRCSKVAGAARTAGFDAILTTDLQHTRYLSGYSGSNGALLLRGDAAWLATDGRYTEQAKTEAPDADLLIGRDLLGLLLEAAGGVLRLGIEPESLSAAAYERISNWALQAGVEFAITDGLVSAARMDKDAEEIAAISEACEISARALGLLIAEGVEGRTERDLAGRLEHLFRIEGAEDRAFDSIVASGPNSAIPHHQPTDREVADGDLLKIDCGARVRGYHADMTRTFAVGKCADWQLEIHRVVLNAQSAALAQIAPGSDVDAIDAVAREAVRSAGYGEYFPHGLGHGVGLQVHERPFLGRGDGILRAGMPITVEPGVYLPGRGGVRIEDTVLVTESGHRVLTEATRELLEI